ncbi:MAG: TRAP transporter large permease [Desulfobacteraceae bacterium]|nr:MAG: TRAP transporter large permease [Desulfobacteraceae bacterium]
MDGLIIVLVALLLMFIGVPVGIAFCMGMITGALFLGVSNIQFVAQGMYNGFNSLPIIAIPCFILAGSVMETGGLSKRLVGIANRLVGNSTGGLGAVTILACLFFGAVSGSAPATVAAIGGIMIPSMVRQNYRKDYSTGLVACAGGLGVIVPPSIPFVIYGFATDTSIGDLFLAGVIPALIIAACLLVVSYFMSKKAGYTGTGIPFELKGFLKVLWDGIWALFMPIIILGGIYGGIFTPTEAAVVALVYGLFVSMLIYRELSFRELFELLDKFVSFNGGIVLTFAPAIALGAIFALLGIPQAVTAGLIAISGNKIVALLLVNAFLLLVGMLLDSITSIIILAPMLLAALQPFGVDPIHFGIIMTINLAVGFVTPPVAANLYVASGMTGIPIERIAKVAFPFIVALLISLLIMTYIPELSLLLIR